MFAPMLHGNSPTLESDRLLLRGWREADRAPFAALSADPHVTEFLGICPRRAESDALVDRIGTMFAEYGFGLWAVEVPGVAPFIGFIGLSVPRHEAHFTPCVEVGWRLARAHWGRGYATEGARAALAFGFEEAGLEEIVSFTAVVNRRSEAVMQRLGMTRDPADDFNHPNLPKQHSLCPHVLYRMRRRDWAAAAEPDGPPG